MEGAELGSGLAAGRTSREVEFHLKRIVRSTYVTLCS